MINKIILALCIVIVVIKTATVVGMCVNLDVMIKTLFLFQF